MVKENKGLISVIVPVYNVEQYLERCVTSLVNQTYNNLEIILVDDGSTDTSGMLCDELKKKDSRIVVIHTENGGLSYARNNGMKVARGECIAFVDSDDYINVRMYEQLYSIMISENSDIVVCGIQYFDEGKDITSDEIESSYVSFDKPDLFLCLCNRDVETVVQWNKLFKREIMENIEYPVGRLHEDVYVIHRELYNCNRITYLNEKLYYYMQRANSIMHTESQKGIQDAIEGYTSRIDFFDKKGLNNEMKMAVDMLLSYTLWKIESISCYEGYSALNAWLFKKYSEMISRYSQSLAGLEFNRELIENPKRFCERKRQEFTRTECVRRIKGICKKMLVKR